MAKEPSKRPLVFRNFDMHEDTVDIIKGVVEKKKAKGDKISFNKELRNVIDKGLGLNPETGKAK